MGRGGVYRGCAAMFETRICVQVQKKPECVHNDVEKVYGQLRLNGEERVLYAPTHIHPASQKATLTGTKP